MLNSIITILTAINNHLHPVKYRRIIIHHTDYMVIRNVREG